MGQAFRRAAGRLRSTSIDTSSSSSSSSAPSRYQTSFDKQQPPVVVPPNDRVQTHNNDSIADRSSNSKSSDEVLEERDISYEAMLSQMAGRIHTKPGGKLEMGEAFVVQKTKRPMPKDRNTTLDTGRYVERPVSAGTLNVAQLRHILLLREGKTDEHHGPVALKEIAERFRVDGVQLDRIFQYVSLPPEDNTSIKKHDPED